MSPSQEQRGQEAKGEAFGALFARLEQGDFRCVSCAAYKSPFTQSVKGMKMDVPRAAFSSALDVGLEQARQPAGTPRALGLLYDGLPPCAAIRKIAQCFHTGS